jgi:hypothetical protein
VRIHLLRATIYDDRGWNWWVEDTRDPFWSDVEVVLLRLDRFRYPFVWLYQDSNVAEGIEPEFAVIGGVGEFAMDSNLGGKHYRYFDEARGESQIELW